MSIASRTRSNMVGRAIDAVASVLAPGPSEEDKQNFMRDDTFVADIEIEDREISDFTQDVSPWMFKGSIPVKLVVQPTFRGKDHYDEVSTVIQPNEEGTYYDNVLEAIRELLPQIMSNVDDVMLHDDQCSRAEAIHHVEDGQLVMYVEMDFTDGEDLHLDVGSERFLV